MAVALSMQAMCSLQGALHTRLGEFRGLWHLLTACVTPPWAPRSRMCGLPVPLCGEGSRAEAWSPFFRSQCRYKLGGMKQQLPE